MYDKLGARQSDALNFPHEKFSIRSLLTKLLLPVRIPSNA